MRILQGALVALFLFVGAVHAQTAGSMGSNAICTNSANTAVPCGGTANPISATLLGSSSSSSYPNRISAGSSLATAVTSCGSTPTVIEVSANLAPAANVTVPSNCALEADGGVITPASGITVTINGAVVDPTNTQFFSTASGGSFAGLRGNIPVELFGAVGNGAPNGSGTDSTSAIQATINSLASGNALLGNHTYIQSSALTITRPNIGIVGTSQGYSYPSNSPASIIVNTSPTADSLDLTGASASSPLVWPKVHNLALERSVVPTGTTTAGVSASFVCGLDMDGVTADDSTIGFHMHATPGCGSSIKNSGAGWGYLSVPSSSYTSQNLIGWFLDSADGSPEESIYLQNIAASFPGPNSASNAIGTLIQGTTINDVDAEYLSTAYLPVGLKVNQTGYGNTIASQDLHLHWLTLDTTSTCAVSINGVSGSYRGSLTIDDFYLSGTGTGICATNSAGLDLKSGQILSGGGATFGTGINLSNITNSMISGNQVEGTTALVSTSSTNNVFDGNVFAGNVSLDASSLGNWAANTVSGTISDSSGSIPQITAGTYTCPTQTVNKYGVVTAMTNGTCAAPVACGTGYAHSVPLTVAAANVSGGANLNSFPVLVSFNGATTNSITLANLKTSANGGQVQSASGYDIIFCTAQSGGTQLSHELVNGSYSPATGAGEWYVNIPTLSSGSANTIYAFWDNASATNTANPSAVWANGYAAVYHFGIGGALALTDSTSSGNTLTNSGATSASAEFGGGVAVTSSSFLYDISAANLSSGSAPRTVEGWANVPSGASGDQTLFGYGLGYGSADQFVVDYSLGTSTLYANVSSDAWIYPQSTSLLGAWHSYAIELPMGATTVNGVLAFVDGVQKTGATCYNTGTCTETLNTSGTDIVINGNAENGTINAGQTFTADEVRVSNVGRSAGWIATEYANQSNPSTFFSLGTVN